MCCDVVQKHGWNWESFHQRMCKAGGNLARFGFFSKFLQFLVGGGWLSDILGMWTLGGLTIWSRFLRTRLKTHSRSTCITCNPSVLYNIYGTWCFLWTPPFRTDYNILKIPQKWMGFRFRDDVSYQVIISRGSLPNASYTGSVAGVPSWAGVPSFAAETVHERFFSSTVVYSFRCSALF